MADQSLLVRRIRITESFKHKQIQIPTQLEKHGFFVVTMENMMQLSDIKRFE